MGMHLTRSLVWLGLVGLASVAAGIRCDAHGPASDDVRTLVEQNRRLLERLETQQQQLDALRARVEELEGGSASTPARVAAPRGTQGQVRVGAEAAVAFFNTGPEGGFPNAEFRVDEAKVQIEAAVWRDTFFWAELELTTREANDEFFHVGELYIDFEGVASIDRDRALNLRIGRFYIPFGEEYQFRSPLANPLISHSLADIWGIDEGIQAYGSIGRFSYNLAVQNGGHKTLRDFNSDKAWTGRVAFDAGHGLRVSASAMRTGDLDPVSEPLSEVWLGNAFLRPLGPAAASRTYGGELLGVDARWGWKHGHLHAAAGWIDFEETRATGRDERTIRYHSVELSHRLAGNLHGALRYSAIESPEGYPIAGQGIPGKYFHNPAAPLMRDLQRLSAGLRYQFGDPLVWKIEYSREEAETVAGAKRGDTDLFASQLGVKF
jgi:hypothetical protein